MKIIKTRIETGVSFTPFEFRKLNQCVSCGRLSDIIYGEQCQECKHKRLKNCKICDILLRQGIYQFFSYDTKDFKRESEIDFKVSKKVIKEFMVEKMYPDLIKKDLCNDCVDWKKNKKNKCQRCGRVFQNNIKHYKEHKNQCQLCVSIENKLLSNN